MATKVGLSSRSVGVDDVFNESNAEIHVLSATQADLTGDGDTVTLDGGATLSVQGVGHVINGSGATIAALANAQISVNGDGDTVGLEAGATVSLHGLGHKVSGSNASIAGLANSQMDVSGDNDSVVLGAGSTASVTGADNRIEGSDDVLSLDGTMGTNVVVGSDDVVDVAAGASADLQGDRNTAQIGAGATVSVSGAGDRASGADFDLSASDGSSFWVGGTGATSHDRVSASHSAVIVGGGSNVDLSGSDDSLAIRGHSHVTLDGDALVARVGVGASVTVASHTPTGIDNILRGADFDATVGASSHVLIASRSATLTVGDDATLLVRRSGNTIHAGASDTISLIGGAANDVILGLNDSVNDRGAGSIFEVHGDIGATTIRGFETDAQAVVELFNGVGGFATAQDALAALTSDGAGGLSLSLGSMGSIDFAGATTASIGAGNFRIG